MIKYPYRYQFRSRRRYRIALRKWRVWNRERIAKLEIKGVIASNK